MSGCERMRDCVCVLRKSSLFFSLHRFMVNKQQQQQASVCVCVHMCPFKVLLFTFPAQLPLLREVTHTSPGHSSWARLDSKKVTQTCYCRLSKHGRAADSTGMTAAIFRPRILSLCSGRPTRKRERETERKNKSDSPTDWCVCVSVWASVFVMQQSKQRNRFPLWFFLYKKSQTTGWAVIVGMGGKGFPNLEGSLLSGIKAMISVWQTL